jgi:hypothetical protein
MSMAMFAGLFLLAVAVPCIAFVKSVKLNSSLPEKEIRELKEKERIVKSFADLSDALRNYQTAQSTKDPNATRLASESKNMIMKLYSDLAGKDTSRVYQDINRSLQMANQFYEYILQSGLRGVEVNPMIAQLQAEKLALANENQVLKIQLAQKGGGGAVVAAPCPPQRPCPPSSSGGSPCPACPECPAGAAPCNCDAAAQTKLNEYKNQIRPTITLMAGNINNIRGDVNRMGVLWIQHKAEKQNIEKNLSALEKMIMDVKSQ